MVKDTSPCGSIKYLGIGGDLGFPGWVHFITRVLISERRGRHQSEKVGQWVQLSIRAVGMPH